MKLILAIIMKIIASTIIAVLAGTASAALRGEEPKRELKSNSRALKGGPPGSPEGKKVFSFNMVGHPKDPTIPSCNNNGNRIFVESTGNSKIEVYQDSSYDIFCQQGNGGDKYALSVPDVGTFDVYVRILGKPDGTLDITACDLYDTDECLVDTFSIKRNTGKSSFTVATNQLFSDKYEDILWKVETDNFKVAQFWFYEL
uniref:Secreted protein n=1 Tax=Odontella aurita TaxID=265563 RepID=A0A6U6JWS4_9STRA